MVIDTSFDFGTDASGKDPDAYSPLFVSTISSCGAGVCQVVSSSSWMTPCAVYLFHGSELGGILPL